MATNQQNLTTSQLGIQHPAVAFVGMLLYGLSEVFVRTLTNGSGQAAAKKTLTVDTYTGAATYSFDIQGETIELVEDSLTNVANVAAALADLINENPNVTVGFARVSGAVITVESVFPGNDFELSTDDAKMTAAVTTPAANGTAIEYGKALIQSGKNGLLPSAASLTKRKITVAGVTGQTNIIINIAGQDIEANAATAANLKTDLEANLATAGLDSLLDVTVAGDDVSIEAATAGQHFNISNTQGTGTSSVTTKGDSIDEVLAGFTYCENWTQGTDTFENGSAMNVWTRGEGLVVELTGVAIGDQLYIGTDGNVYRTPGANRVSTQRLAVMDVVGSTFGVLKLVA